MKLFLLFGLYGISLLGFGQGTTIAAKIPNSGRLLTFYNDESLKKNSKGEVIAGTPIVDYILIPQGTQLNIVFKKGALIEFNEQGKVKKGTIAADYNFRDKKGIFKTFSSGDQIDFDSKGQVIVNTESNNVANFGEICKYNEIPFYCKSVQRWPLEDGKEIVNSGIIAKANYSFLPYLAPAVKAKKDTWVLFFTGCNWMACFTDKKEQAKVCSERCKGIVGTVSNITIDGSYKFLMYGCAHEIEFPDGTEIEFYPSTMKPAIFWNNYNLVYKAKLGRDAYIPTLGMVKKGKTIVSVHPFTEGLETSHGYLKIEN